MAAQDGGKLREQEQVDKAMQEEQILSVTVTQEEAAAKAPSGLTQLLQLVRRVVQAQSGLLLLERIMPEAVVAGHTTILEQEEPEE